MYKILFFGGISVAFMSTIFSIFIFRKNDVLKSIKDLIYIFTMGMIVFVAGKTCITGYASDTTAPLISEVSYISMDGNELDKTEDVIYCKGEITIEFKAEDKDSGIKKTEDGFDIVYIKIKDGEMLHYAPPVEGNKGFYSVSLFGEDWTELEDGYFDGIIEIYAQDIADNIGSYSTIRVVHYNGIPELFIKTADEKNEKYIIRNNKEAIKHKMEWTSDDLDMCIDIKDKVGISRIAYSFGAGEETITYDENMQDEELQDIAVKKEDNVTFTINSSAINKNGVPIKVTVENYCGSIRTDTVWVLIDKEEPVIKDIFYTNSTNDFYDENDTIYSNRPVKLCFELKDDLSGINDDEVYALLSDGRMLKASKNNKDIYYVEIIGGSTVIEEDIINNKCIGFEGIAVIYVSDMSGNIVSAQSKKIIYNSERPELNVKTEGVTGKWTNDNVRFNIIAKDSAVGLRNVCCYIDGNKVKESDIIKGDRTCEFEYELNKTVKDKKGYKVEINAVNMCGSEVRKTYKVYIDKESPVLSFSGVVSGRHYSQNVNLEMTVSDVSYSATKISYYVSRKLDGLIFKENYNVFVPKVNSANDNLLFEYEGEYTIYAVGIDGAGNKTVTKPIMFVIDRTAPVLSIDGVKDGSFNGKPVSLQFRCMESFYGTNNISVIVSHTYGQKNRESSLFIFNKDKMDEAVIHSFGEDGSYYVSVAAVDKAGNKAQEKHIHFVIDRTTPKVKIIGTKSYEQWDKPVELTFKVDEYNYGSNKVTVSGIRTDIDGYEHTLKLPTFKSTGSVSLMKTIFEEDGLYDIRIVSKDKAGNEARKRINFLIDTQKPEIIGIDALSGGYYRELSLSDIIKNMFRDLTLSSFRVFLNGMEYDGTERELTEGKYNLYVEAYDELGHSNNKSAEFIIDNTAPEVLFFGADDGDKVFERGVITWKLDDANDKITKIYINGEEVSADQSDLRYNEYGKYCIEIECADSAGNEGYSKLMFEYTIPDQKSFKKTDGKNDSMFEKNNIKGYLNEDMSSGNIIKKVIVIVSVLLLSACVAMGIMVYKMKGRKKND